MEILEAFDLTGSQRGAAELESCSGRPHMLMRRTGVQVWMVAAVLGLAATLPGGARGAHLAARACGPMKDRTVLAEGALRAYVTADGAAFACDEQNGNVVPLTSVVGAATFLLPVPAVAIAGSTIAYGEDDLSDATGSQTETFIQVLNLGGQPGSRRTLAILPAQPSPEGAGAGSKVVTTVVKADGAVAWISCLRGPRIPESDLAVGRRARCQHAGTYSWVYSEDAAEERGQVPGSDGAITVPRLLDQGVHIAPLSLKLRGSKLTWRHGSKLRSGTLT
jgi:hypothetical protein